MTTFYFHPSLTIIAEDSRQNSGSLPSTQLSYLYIDADGRERHVHFDKPREISVLNVGKVHTDDLKPVFGWIIPGLVDADQRAQNSQSIAQTLQQRGIADTEYTQRAFRIERAGKAVEVLRDTAQLALTAGIVRLGTRATRMDA